MFSSLHRSAGIEHLLRPAIEFYVESDPVAVTALLDCGARYCILGPQLARELGIDEGSGDERLATRFGTLHGSLHDDRISFSALEGEGLELTVPCFISERWPGPSVIGWTGCLEELRFALDWKQASFFYALSDG